MKKIFLLIVAFGCMAAQAQTEEIDAISATQGESTDWYRFADYDDVIDVSITAQGIQFPGDPGKTYAIADGAVYTAFGTAPEEKITLSAADFSVTKDGDWVYDKTEKRVNVEFISVENPGPPADKITIYYNNDKLVKPINPGTYQVYIDIEETDIYAAVTGITSEAWKFDITMPTFVEEGLKFEVTSLDPKTVKVIANDYTGSSFTIPATVSYLEDDYAVTAIGENAFAGVGTVAAPADLLLPADWEGIKPEATATLWYGGYFVDYRAATIADIKAASDEAENSIEEDATGFVGIEGVKQAKADAASALADAQATADNTISAAVDMIAITNAKDNAINAIHMATDEASVAIQAAIVSFKEGTIDEIENVATHNKNSILEYAVADQVKETARNEIDKAVAEAEASINNADSEEQVNDAKNDAQNKINQQLAYVQNYYAQLQAIKAAALAAIDKAAAEAEAAIYEAAGDYASIQSIREIIDKAKADFAAIKNEASIVINEKLSKDEVSLKEEEVINTIKSKQDNVVAEIQAAIQALWITLRTEVTANDWNTICMERTITDVDGATFWNVVSETEKEFILEQEFAPFAAGVGYIIRYTATELKVKYGDQKATEPVTATIGHPIQGNFAEITCDEHGTNDLVGNYVVYGNQLCKVTGWVTMADHRAYVVADLAPKQAPAPTGAPRMTMPKPNNTPTGLGQSAITNHKSAMKVIENGQFRIVRDNKMYNAQGIEL